MTVVFTDVEGSTAMRSRLGDGPVTALLRSHEARVRAQTGRGGGRVVKTLGDGMLLAFASPAAAIKCAVAIQDEQARHNQTDGGSELLVRVGMTTGEVVEDGGDLKGQAVHAAARIVARAKGGEILLAEVVRQLAGPVAGIGYVDRGRVALRGFPDRWRLVGLQWSPATCESEGAAATVGLSPGGRAPPARRPFVGRGEELRALEAALARAGAGHFQCVFVLGDAGLGKSSLATELAARAERDVVPLTARAFPLGGTTSFGIWIEALDRHVRTLPLEEVLRVCGAYVDDLAAVLPSALAARGSAPAGEPPRSRLLQGLSSLLRELSSQRTVVIVLDDVHLADTTSWEALGWFARNLAEQPILVVATARPAELRANPGANEVVLRLEQDGFAETVTLGGLTMAELAELAQQALSGAAPPAALLGWLEERSRGNPLFALGLMRALLEEGADLEAPALRQLPESLSGRVGARLSVLDEPSLATLETLAVLGARVEIGDLTALSGRPLERLAPILDVLVESRLVSFEQSGSSLVYEIAHPLIQEAIYQRIGPARRRALHRRVARELSAVGRLGMAAPHFAQSADVGDSEAVDALGQAVQQAEERELYGEALVLLRVLREILPVGDDRWLTVLDAMSWNADWVVDHRADQAALQGVEALREIMGMLEENGDRVRLAGVQLRLASFLAWGAGEVEQARRLFTAALAELEAAGEHERALIARNELAWVAGMDGGADDHARAAREVLAAAESAGDRFVRMQALGMLADAETSLGAFSAAEAHLRSSIEIAKADGKRYRRIWNEGFLAAALAQQGRFTEAKGIMDGIRQDPIHPEAIALDSWTRAQNLTGDFEGVLSFAGELMARYPDGVSRRRGFAIAEAALAAVELGRAHDAIKLLSVVEAIFAGRQWFHSLEVTAWVAGLIAWQGGQLERAREVLEAAAVSEVNRSYNEMVGPMLVDLLEVCALLGDAERARENLDRLQHSVGKCDGDLFPALAQLGAAAAGLAEGDVELAARTGQAAADAFARLGCPNYEGRALAIAGEAVANSDRTQAAELLGRALKAFERCGASWRRQLVLNRLSRLGTRGRRVAVAGSGPSALSSREREVAGMAAEGQTAKEIAVALIIGERTVETHLANVYAKLGVRSKQELRRRAGELGL